MQREGTNQITPELKNSIPTNVTVQIKEESEKTANSTNPIITVRPPAKAAPMMHFFSSKTVYGPPAELGAPLIQTRPFTYCGVPTGSTTDQKVDIVRERKDMQRQTERGQ